MRRKAELIWVPVLLASSTGCISLGATATLSQTRPGQLAPSLVQNSAMPDAPGALPRILSRQSNQQASSAQATESLGIPEGNHPLSAEPIRSPSKRNHFLPPLSYGGSGSAVASAVNEKTTSASSSSGSAIQLVSASTEVTPRRDPQPSPFVQQLGSENLPPREFPEDGESFESKESGNDIVMASHQEPLLAPSPSAQNARPSSSAEPTPTPADSVRNDRSNLFPPAAAPASTNTIFEQRRAVAGNSSIPTLSRSRNPIPNLEIYLAGKRVTGNNANESVAEKEDHNASSSAMSSSGPGPKIIDIPPPPASALPREIVVAKELPAEAELAAAREIPPPVTMEIIPAPQKTLPPPEPVASEPLDTDSQWTQVKPEIPQPAAAVAENPAPPAPSVPEVPAIPEAMPAAETPVAPVAQAVPPLPEEMREPADSTTLSLVDCCDELAKDLIPLVKQLDSQDPLVRARGLEALAACGTEARAAAPAVHSLLQDEEPVVSIYAAFALREIAGDSWNSVKTLTRHLNDEDVQIVRLSAYLLGRYGPEAMDAATTLNATLKTKNDLLTQLYVSEALIQIIPADHDAVEVLTGAIKHQEADIRWFAAMALANVADPFTREAVVALISGLRDDDQGVQQAACLSLAAIGRSARLATPELIKVARSDSEDVRFAAETALACLRK